ncbi:MAG TPA: glycosyltransferase family 4 protein [Solirubrobacterales bacterium]|nr:glycosyltransferase family 4 protein [Solirubrobacterales bacterium]
MGRILMILRPDEGGAFEHVTQLSAGIARSGHEVAICGLEGRPREDFGDVIPPEVEVLPLKMVRAVSPLPDAQGLAGLVASERRFRPDLVHAHGSKEAALGRLARGTRPRVPFAYTPHGYAFAKPFMTDAERRSYRRFERVLAPLATLVICICEAERRLAAQIGPARRTRVVHNGIKPPPAGPSHPLTERLRERGPVVCALSGLRVGKGLETLIEAFAAVVAAHPDASLVIAGEGPERAALEELAERSQIASSVHLIGEVTDVFEVLRGADVFVHPSWAESFPYAVLEAMASEVPAIATDVGGTGEAIESGESGVLVPPRDPAALSEAISGLIGDPGRAGALAAAANRRFKERFTLERMVEGTLEIYAELGI